jgi:hypothetical protein
MRRHMKGGQSHSGGRIRFAGLVLRNMGVMAMISGPGRWSWGGGLAMVAR